MKEEKPSFTANVTTGYRMIESRKPAGERVCYDPLAEYFLNPEYKKGGISGIWREIRLWIFEKIGRGWPEYYVARTRYIDDTLESYIEAGLDQLVILGAGYDSRAYRFEKLKEKTKVFEVDHPATQKMKTLRVREKFGTVPNHVIFVSVDFGSESLKEKLFESGYDKQLATLFIWEGVTPYLTPEAVNEILGFIAMNSGEGSSVIFDYTLPSVIDGTCKRSEAWIWRKGAKRTGEPLTFGIDPRAMKDFLSKRGLCEVSNLTSNSLKEAYFKGVNLKREITPIMGIVRARVKFQREENPTSHV